ncbi:HAD family phosphatase [Kribbella sp. NPDC050281]|uniref:HAD family hydrolase n=1 Tax=Kribbella sp. NPDC050281 TaxID=3155515 RepID=UPI0033FD4DC1
MATANEVQAVVFDLDGVLVDSEPLWEEIRRGVVADAGRAWPTDATRALQGMSTPEWSAYLIDVIGVPGRPEDVAAMVIDAMVARYRKNLPLLPGAIEAVERLANHWPLGLASSSPRQLIATVLDSADLAGRFQVTVSTEEVTAGKPSPAVYNDVVRRLAADASRVVAIEDSSNGLRSASAAGVRVIAIPNPTYPPQPDALALASTVVASLDDLTQALVASLVPQA